MPAVEWKSEIHVDERRGPSVSMALFWLFLVVALVIMLDPLNPGVFTEAGYLRLPRDIGPLKYTAFTFGLPGLGLAAAGLVLFNPTRWNRFVTTLKSTWPVIALALLILGGSLYARFIAGIKESYLAAGIGMLAFPIGLAMLMESRDSVKTVHGYFIALLLSSFYMTYQIIVHRRIESQAFHEEIFLLVPLLVYWHLVNEKNWSAWLWIPAFSAVAFVSYKNTSYLVLLVSIGYLFAIRMARKFEQYRGDSLKRFVLGYGSAVAWIIVIAILALVVVLYREDMPSGNTGVRTYVYQAAWEKFLDSPLYGAAFTDNSNIDFPQFTVTGQNRVVNHSDWLDVLSHGGLLGFLLFVGALWTPFRLSRMRTMPPHPRLRSALHGLKAITLGGMVVMLFNPVLLNMPINTLFWFNAGLLVGLGQLYGKRHPPAADIQ